MTQTRVFISADHGLAIVYFLQSDVVPTLLQAGVEVVLLTDDGLKEQITRRFGQPGLTIEGLRLKQARAVFREQVNPTAQWWLHFLRRMGGSNRINVEALMDGHMRQMAGEASPRRRMLLPADPAGDRRCCAARRRCAAGSSRPRTASAPTCTPTCSSTTSRTWSSPARPAGAWTASCCAQAARRGVKTRRGHRRVGQPSSSYRLPGAPVDWINCWSEIQKEELVLGSDWSPERVHIGGIPSYDGYFRKQWLMPREEYFRLHGLDPQRKLLSYACSFVTFSPNYQNIESAGPAGRRRTPWPSPAQLLIRLHPNHFMAGSLFEKEAERVRELVPAAGTSTWSSRSRWGASWAITRGRTCPKRPR